MNKYATLHLKIQVECNCKISSLRSTIQFHVEIPQKSEDYIIHKPENDFNTVFADLGLI